MLESPTTAFNNLFEFYAEQGFLSDGLPLARLPNPHYEAWEDVASQLPTLIETGQIREKIDNFPICSTEHLQTEAEWRRAYSIMGYLAHAYIWGGETPKDRLPPAIAKPYLEISAHLELPACATYAGLVLWNYKTTHPDADITNPDNLHVQTSFTGTKDEEWFMLISVAVEAKGSALISLMRDACKAVVAEDAELVAALLCKFGDEVSILAYILKRMYEHNEPAVFYHVLRPFLAGSKNMGHAGLPNGVYYDVGDSDGAENPENWLQLSGGSNAQSSLIQALDIFLGVEHSASDGKNPSGPIFIQEMRRYMPGPHRRFLEDLAAQANVRSFVSGSSTQSLKDAYNSAVNELKCFRDAHIQIVTRYVVMMSKKPNPFKQEKNKLNLATASSQAQEGENSPELAGTGGTDLIPFLKETRDDVRNAKC
ncbi:hypothetical protein N7457_007778 [Penicillium paradoxum]|uniref:uncharacterized protein n=1 Tax=Penicillium paradoxum TaxID=176176 RepID=UPI002546B22D|nr:uncharacterized protein N7457_007778 [Penicillium paradoxum]KAJ5772882.1 hypothetical protein N7457_007778 [Penicillium paradoxum]